MDKPIDICVNISGHIIASIKTEFHQFLFWHTVKKALSLNAFLQLYVADQQPPAFAYVNIYCEIPPTSFITRAIRVRTYSVDWNEHTLPGVILAEREIPRMIEEEEKILGYAPRITLMTSYPSVTSEESDKALRISFREILCEFDATGEEKLDYESLVSDIAQEIKTIHRVWLRIKELE